MTSRSPAWPKPPSLRLDACLAVHARAVSERSLSVSKRRNGTVPAKGGASWCLRTWSMRAHAAQPCRRAARLCMTSDAFDMVNRTRWPTRAMQIAPGRREAFWPYRLSERAWAGDRRMISTRRARSKRCSVPPPASCWYPRRSRCIGDRPAAAAASKPVVWIHAMRDGFIRRLIGFDEPGPSAISTTCRTRPAPLKSSTPCRIRSLSRIECGPLFSVPPQTSF